MPPFLSFAFHRLRGANEIRRRGEKKIGHEGIERTSNEGGGTPKKKSKNSEWSVNATGLALATCLLACLPAYLGTHLPRAVRTTNLCTKRSRAKKPLSFKTRNKE